MICPRCQNYMTPIDVAYYRCNCSMVYGVYDKYYALPHNDRADGLSLYWEPLVIENEASYTTRYWDMFVGYKWESFNTFIPFDVSTKKLRMMIDLLK